VLLVARADLQSGGWATGGVGRRDPDDRRRRTSSWWCLGAFGRKTATTSGTSRDRAHRRARHPRRGIRAGGDADCVVYSGACRSRQKKRFALCRILSAARTRHHIASRAPSMNGAAVGALSRRDSASGHRPFEFDLRRYRTGFAADLFPIALMTMSHKVDSVRASRSPTTRDTASRFDMREFSGSASHWTIRSVSEPGCLTWVGRRR